MQLLIGGENKGNGNGLFADKIIKFPSKRIIKIVETLLQDYESNKQDDEKFNSYYLRNGKDYFYQLLKPLADLSRVNEREYIDWGQEERFKPAIGIGECAGVVIDLVQTLCAEALEKIELAKESISNYYFADGIYHAYAAIINAAKALLTSLEINVSSHHAVIENFDKNFMHHDISIKTFTEKIKQNKPTEDFAISYLKEAKYLLKAIEKIQLKQLEKYEN